MKKIVLVATLTAALGVGLLQIATAAITGNTIESTAALARHGTGAEVGVLLACDETQRTWLRVTVNRGGSPAVAEGRASIVCTNELTRFGVDVHRRHARLTEGAATACVLAVTSDDSRQWCKEITLTD